ncbi:MAG: hypothetical protein ABC606_00725 [Candidatus Methanosuratincola petrocarbonis]
MSSLSAIGEGNPYGYGLAALGAGLAGFSWYLLQSTPMTALGIGIAVVGASIGITPTAPVPSKAVRKLLEGSMLNIEAILEDTGATNRGYYVPATAEGKKGAAGGGEEDGGMVRVFVPLGDDASVVPSRWEARGLVSVIDGREYLVLHPPGALLLRNEELSGDLESLLHTFLVEETGLVESVSASEEAGGSVAVEFRKPRARAVSGRVGKMLGSLESGIAAAVIASARGKVARVASEEDSEKGDRRRAVIELL